MQLFLIFAVCINIHSIKAHTLTHTRLSEPKGASGNEGDQEAASGNEGSDRQINVISYS